MAAIAIASPAAAQSPPAPAAPQPAPAAPQPAPAAPPAATPPLASAASRADALFQEGKRLLEAGSTAEACKLLAESDAIDPSVSALGLLAACHEQQGRLAAAWRAYVETAKRADIVRDERGAFARQRAAALEPRLPRITIHVPKPIAGLEIRYNGEVVRAGAIAVDPGPIDLAFSAPEREAQHIRLNAREAAVITLEAPDLAPHVPPPAPCPPPESVASPGLGARVPAGIAVGGLGLAGLGVGIGFGAQALDRSAASKTLRDACAGGSASACVGGRDANEGARRAATISTIGFAAGGVGIGVAIAVLAWPRGRAPDARRGGLQITPLVGTNGAGASLQGSF